MSESTPEIEVYASRFCPYCHWARGLLDSKEVSYRLYDVDKDFSLRKEMMERSQRTSVPQIFINGRHIGGFDDLSALDREGKLDPFLAEKAAAD